MGDTFRGTAIQSTNQRTNRMIMTVSIGIVFALFVGGFVMAVNNEGGQNQEPVGDVEIMTVDGFDLVEMAQPQTLRKLDFVLESEIQTQSFYVFSKRLILPLKDSITWTI